jgi:hypothetical protein
MSEDIDAKTLDPLVKKAQEVYENAKKRARGSFSKLSALIENESDTHSKMNVEGRMVELTDDVFISVFTFDRFKVMCIRLRQEVPGL